MATTEQLVTAEELLCMPDDGFRYELVRGELRKMPPSSHHPSRMTMRVSIPLGAYVFDAGLGEMYSAEGGFRIASDPDIVRVPDAAYVRRERVEAAGEVQGFFPGPPDLAVEVISPSDTYSEVEEKVADWLDAGTRAVVVVDPRRRTVKVHRSVTDTEMLSDKDTLAVDDVVPGWACRSGRSSSKRDRFRSADSPAQLYACTGKSP